MHLKYVNVGERGELVAVAPANRLAKALETVVRRPPAKAVDAVASMRVVRLNVEPFEQWIVIGERGDYIVIPRLYCSCPAFTLNGVLKGRLTPCYHMVSVELAKRVGKFVDLVGKVDSSTVTLIVEEAFTVGRSPTLRKILGW